jgi:hypothetical protein
MRHVALFNTQYRVLLVINYNENLEDCHRFECRSFHRTPPDNAPL